MTSVLSQQITIISLIAFTIYPFSKTINNYLTSPLFFIFILTVVLTASLVSPEADFIHRSVHRFSS